MNQFKVLVSGFLAAGLLAAAATPLLAGDARKAPAGKSAPTAPATKRRTKSGAAPGRPVGVARPQPVVGLEDGVDTVTATRNAAGDTVYSVSATRFDISPPLRDLAARATPAATSEENEPSLNPHLPFWRTQHSGVPDPVVQTDIPPAGFPKRLSVELAPSAGFNFAGVGSNGGTPSDSNGSVGNNQFVEIVNTRYQVWSLNRTAGTATSIVGPAAINTLWSGFGGACQTQNSGDPIVLFDKLAGRWLLSQFTSSPDGSGTYYQCVALSTTADATGTYARWAFAVPRDPATGAHVFGDYPHFGVWTDAYYMMAHGFTGGYVGALFAALDRSAMLQGLPSATWQVIVDTTEGGHMPADLDGFAPPPTGAPGIFISLHSSGMVIYRMKVDFVTPANTVKIRQATVPVAPSTGACELSSTPGTCIPQPAGGQFLDSLGDRLMFRAAYRNFLDHESLVVTHSVDPSVTGVASGVRWYDFRLSGTPDATCPVYPCTYQQGTIADVASGRSRWMPSIAMDTAENILVGYSASGKANVGDNHSLRYTGRAKGDPPGAMTVPERVIATGNRNETNASRWGDYSSMSIDPFDDCTFWYVGQYYNGSTTYWSTRIASASWPAGDGPGQCPATTCTARPASAPTNLAATATGDNQITVTWTGAAPGAYAVERAAGACGSEALYQPLGATTGASVTDTTVQGGLTYSYRVIAAADPAGKCQALVTSPCVDATATGLCNLRPAFAGVATAANQGEAVCGIQLNWTPASSSCPLTPAIRYNIFRGTTPDFVPSPANRIAACVPDAGGFLDDSHVASGVTYYYVVRAEDSSTGHGGECGGGNEESNGVVVPGTAFGGGAQPDPGVWTDGGGDGATLMLLNVAGPGDTSDQTWRVVTTAKDPGANHTAGGVYAYRNSGPAAGNTYTPNTCAEMRTPPLVVHGTNTTLQFWERHQLEYHWDGVAVEYSRNGGPWTSVPAPSNSVADGCAASDATSDWQTLECTQDPPVNACGYPAATTLYSGPLGSGSSCGNYATGAAVTPYAHRCHPIAGLTAGDTVQFRWRFTSDPGAEYAGFYLDDVAVTDITLPDACTPGAGCHSYPPPNCDDGDMCTIDSCDPALGCVHTFSDTFPPTIVCPASQTVECQANLQSMVVLPTATATDPCQPNVPITNDHTPNGADASGLFALGATTVTFTAADGSGSTAHCSTMVTVADTTRPTVSCPASITREFTGAAGAAVSFTATATDSCAASLSPACSPAPGATFAIGATPVACSASDPSGNSGACAFTVTVLGPLGVTQDVLAELMALRGTISNRDDQHKLDDAIRKLSDSLASSLWMGQTHLQRRHGEDVFNRAKETVQKLADLKKNSKSHISPAILQGFIDRLVRGDRELAFVAIQDAFGSDHDQHKLNEAMEKLAAGDQEAGRGKADNAIDRYREAWKKAVEAVRLPPTPPNAGAVTAR